MEDQESQEEAPVVQDGPVGQEASEGQEAQEAQADQAVQEVQEDLEVQDTQGDCLEVVLEGQVAEHRPLPRRTARDPQLQRLAGHHETQVSRTC